MHDCYGRRSRRYGRPTSAVQTEEVYEKRSSNLQELEAKRPMSPLHTFFWRQLNQSSARNAEELAFVTGYPLEAVLIALAVFTRRRLIEVDAQGEIRFLS